MPSTTDARSASLHSSLFKLLKRVPVSVAPDASLLHAVKRMSEERVGSVVVVDPETNHPTAIFTLRDLLRHMASGMADMDVPIQANASGSELITLNSRSTAYKAALLMSQHDVHHIIVVDSSRKFLGVVAQEDIYELQRGGSKAIVEAILGARNYSEVIEAAQSARQWAEHCLFEIDAVETLNLSISALNDLISIRIIELVQRDFAVPDVPWAWLLFGSEGRNEQTLVTDQDNGIVFDAGQEGAESLRQGFLPFAKEVNRRLDECGFTYCKGNIMAGNPELCLSLDEWQAKYQSWLSSTSPQAVLNSTIFFDVRLLYGSNHLVEELVSWLTSRLPGATLFLRFMAMDALRTRPPLGFMNGFQFDQNKTFHGTLDLKTYGTRIYVDAARILALANGIPETSTIERLREASKKNMIAADDIEAIVSGFNHLQRLRLRVQKCATPMGLANRISPEQLNTIDRRILKECFKLAGKLQRGLKLEYDL